jgi:hypothetical protein
VGAFGDKLRRQREQRGIALEAVSNSTKISTRMLRALEDEHFDQLPGGVFNKGFVRAYARHIGLDEEEAIAGYLAALRDSQMPAPSPVTDSHAAAPDLGNDLRGNDGNNDRELRRADRRKQGRRDADRHSEDRHDRARHNEDRRNKDLSSSPDSATHAPPDNPPARRSHQQYPAGSPAQPANDSSTRIPWGKLALALLLVTFALSLWNSRRHSPPAAAAHPAADSNQSPASAPPAFSAPASTTMPPSSSAGSLPVKASPARTLSAGKPSAGSETISGSGNKTAAPPATSFTLLIRAEKTAWVSILADGKPVAAETLIAPAHTSIRASTEIVVKTGNAAGVSFLLNGKEIPAQGDEGEVKTYVFDANGLRAPPQTQPPPTNR